MPGVMVVGASGLVGNAVLELFLSRPYWGKVVAVSRRTPEVDSTRPFATISVDLRDAEATDRAFSRLTGITHIVYAAVYERQGLVAGWTDAEQMQTNLDMFRNCLAPVAKAGSLRHVSLLQGGKAYGSHLHAVDVPAREELSRDDHENFYWRQEDHVKESAARNGFTWTIFRPRAIVGRSWGVAMSIVPVLGAYAAICRETGASFGFPGGGPSIQQATDTRLLAAAIEWAALSPGAANEHFNIDNGDLFEWRPLWPVLANILGVEAAPDAPMSMADFFASKDAVWENIVAKYQLRRISLKDLLGQSAQLADFLFRHGMDDPRTALTSGIKLRMAGFLDFVDTRDSLAHHLRDLAGRRVIPDSRSYAATG